MSRRHTKFLHEGEYAVEVEVELIEGEEGWSPYLPLEEAAKLDAVREALRRGDVREASKVGRVYRMTPVSASA